MNSSYEHETLVSTRDHNAGKQKYTVTHC